MDIQANETIQDTEKTLAQDVSQEPRRQRTDAKLWKKMLNTLTDVELNTVSKIVRDLQSIRLRRKVQKGDFEPLTGDELEMISNNNAYDAVRVYSERVGCSLRFGKTVVDFHRRDEARTASERVLGIE